MATGRPNFGDVQLKDTWKFYSEWVAPREHRAENFKRVLRALSTPTSMRVLGMTFLYAIIARNWYTHLSHFHPEYDWQLGVLRKYRDEELYAPPKGTAEPPSRDQLVVKS